MLRYVLLILLLVPSSAAAFDARNPDSVALAVMPFESPREEDQAITFLLEDYLKANLSRKIRHPVSAGDDLSPALPDSAEACVADALCLELLGGQFNASLVVRVQVFRTGPELQLETEWYATGNGVRVGRESATFEIGDEKSMVESFQRWFQLYFDSSLRVTPANRAGEGGVIRRTEDDARSEDLRRAKEKKVSSRRSDFGSSREDDDRFDRSDPLADLRRDEDDEPRDKPRRAERRADRRSDPAPIEEDYDDLDEPEPEPKPRAKTRRPAERRADPTPVEEDEFIDLDAEEESGGTVNTYTEAQRLGYGKREYQRFATSGETLQDFDDRRWAFGKRFHLRVGAYYGMGYLTRRYASTIFIRVGGVKTDEYAWERLGMSFVNPGISFGVGFNPVDVFGIEFDASFMLAQQDLRREYDSQDLGSNVGDVAPEVRPSGHAVFDILARFFIFPKKRVKLSPGLGATILVLQGFSFDDQTADQLEYSSRPTAAVVGLTPAVGGRFSVSPFVTIYADLSATIYLSQGETNYEEHQVFTGTEPLLEDEKKQVPLPVIPIMGRLNGGVMILF